MMTFLGALTILFCVAGCAYGLKCGATSCSVTQQCCIESQQCIGLNDSCTVGCGGWCPSGRYCCDNNNNSVCVETCPLCGADTCEHGDICCGKGVEAYCSNMSSCSELCGGKKCGKEEICCKEECSISCVTSCEDQICNGDQFCCDLNGNSSCSELPCRITTTDCNKTTCQTNQLCCDVNGSLICQNRTCQTKCGDNVCSINESCCSGDVPYCSMEPCLLKCGNEYCEASEICCGDDTKFCGSSAVCPELCGDGFCQKDEICCKSDKPHCESGTECLKPAPTLSWGFIMLLMGLVLLIVCAALILLGYGRQRTNRRRTRQERADDVENMPEVNDEIPSGDSHKEPMLKPDQ
ncbi:uncharacterized protein LOC100178508 [Ciona intestinalis]